jgi:LysM repeat protein
MRTTITILISMLAVCVLVACSLPASTALQILPTNTSAVPFPVVTSADAVHNAVSGTQTAQALSGTIQPTNQLPTVSAATATQSYQLPTAGSTYNAVISSPTIAPTHLDFATSTPGRPATYTIHAGESCYCLARRFNVDPDTLISANGTNCNTNLQPGTVINIPQSSEWSGVRYLKTHPANYTVVSGQTIYTIACEFGDVDPNLIIAANGLVNPYTLTAGQVLYIP